MLLILPNKNIEKCQSLEVDETIKGMKILYFILYLFINVLSFRIFWLEKQFTFTKKKIFLLVSTSQVLSHTNIPTGIGSCKKMMEKIL